LSKDPEDEKKFQHGGFIAFWIVWYFAFVEYIVPIVGTHVSVEGKYAFMTYVIPVYAIGWFIWNVWDWSGLKLQRPIVRKKEPECNCDPGLIMKDCPVHA
jgi:hypothetical protein